ncbi:hypothetical protein SPBR_03887 [Sporothrix brasiliensis 5110]|uniref:Uncharacterized protein n=1 Tax=Sporothrix brasiliensis 5110 TaxID=1398154 RepID=A0A0C2JEC7_9PEZI|nr:uncharacterized protein SPBR_03887 [Sporothrix brasiliensis 5110]KIH95312.1 hypothetical protein SPBR_03887 [Sporothrix brasiliensis 5110]
MYHNDYLHGGAPANNGRFGTENGNRRHTSYDNSYFTNGGIHARNGSCNRIHPTLGRNPQNNGNDYNNGSNSNNVNNGFNCFNGQNGQNGQNGHNSYSGFNGSNSYNRHCHNYHNGQNGHNSHNGSNYSNGNNDRHNFQIQPYGVAPPMDRRNGNSSMGSPALGLSMDPYFHSAPQAAPFTVYGGDAYMAMFPGPLPRQRTVHQVDLARYQCQRQGHPPNEGGPSRRSNGKKSGQGEKKPVYRNKSKDNERLPENRGLQYAVKAAAEDDGVPIDSNAVIDTEDALKTYLADLLHSQPELGYVYSLGFQGVMVGSAHDNICAMTVKADVKMQLRLNGPGYDPILIANNRTKLGNTNRARGTALRPYFTAELFAACQPRVIDVKTLGVAAFETHPEGHSDMSLRRIMEDGRQAKLMFAPHMPAVSLDAVYGIRFDRYGHADDEGDGPGSPRACREEEVTGTEAAEMADEERERTMTKAEGKKPMAVGTSSTTNAVPEADGSQPPLGECGTLKAPSNVEFRGLFDIQLCEAVLAPSREIGRTERGRTDPDAEAVKSRHQFHDHYRLMSLVNILKANLRGNYRQPEPPAQPAQPDPSDQAGQAGQAGPSGPSGPAEQMQLGKARDRITHRLRKFQISSAAYGRFSDQKQRMRCHFRNAARSNPKANEFSEGPLDPNDDTRGLVRYCIYDVLYLPHLFCSYYNEILDLNPRLPFVDQVLLQEVRRFTHQRVQKAAMDNGLGSNNAVFSPFGWIWECWLVRMRKLWERNYMGSLCLEVRFASLDTDIGELRSGEAPETPRDNTLSGSRAHQMTRPRKNAESIWRPSADSAISVVPAGAAAPASKNRSGNVVSKCVRSPSASALVKSRRTPWKKGTLNRSGAPGSTSTRCVVAGHTPCVTTSKAWPMLTTNVPGTAGTSIHWPARLSAWSPPTGGGLACRRNVHQPDESLCGPTPWTPPMTFPGYRTSLRRCWSDRNGWRASGGRSSASATSCRKRSPNAVRASRYASTTVRMSRLVPGTVTAPALGHWFGPRKLRRTLRRKLHLLASVRLARRRFCAGCTVAQKVWGVAQVDGVFGLVGQGEQCRQHLDHVVHCLVRHAVVGDIQKADVDKRVTQSGE